MMAKKKNVKDQIVVYQGPTGALELKADAGKETIWATLNQIAALFATDNKSGVSRHINNILKSGELGDSTVAKLATVQQEERGFCFCLVFTQGRSPGSKLYHSDSIDGANAPDRRE